MASDIDPQACSALKEVIAGHRFRSVIDISSGSFFDYRPPHIPRDPGLVVINPPYGRRIEAPEGLHTLLLRIGRKLIDDFPGWKYALMVPIKSMLQQFPLSAQVFPLSHGGLQVWAAIGKVPGIV